LTNLEQQLKSNVKDDILNNRAKVKTNIANLKQTSNDQNSNGVVTSAAELDKNVKNMVSGASTIAKTYTKPNQSLQVNNLLNQIEKKQIQEIKQDSVPQLIDSIKKSVIPKQEPKTFEDVVDKVAQDIRDKVATTELKYAEAGNVADALTQLATAARKGQRQQMLVAGRSVATHVATIEAELRALAQRVGNKNPIVQDKLIRFAQALRNYSTQLKILTSVKAASIEQNTDSDATLSSITKSLGNVLTESLSTIDVAKINILKEKK